MYKGIYGTLGKLFLSPLLLFSFLTSPFPQSFLFEAPQKGAFIKVSLWHPGLISRAGYNEKHNEMSLPKRKCVVGFFSIAT